MDSGHPLGPNHSVCESRISNVLLNIFNTGTHRHNRQFVLLFQPRHRLRWGLVLSLGTQI
jgi:hypothetical protein